MKNHEGYLFTKLASIGSKSEGPTYYLQQNDNSELLIKKVADAWKPDPILHQFIARKVVVSGDMQGNQLHYEKIVETKPDKTPWVSVGIDLPGNTLWVNKMPGSEASGPQKHVQVSLYVQWPYITPLQGTAPTSQIFDLEILTPSGKSLWKWSEGKRFIKQVTKVALEGMIRHEFKGQWDFFDKDISAEGEYKVVGRFLPINGVVEKGFVVKFAR